MNLGTAISFALPCCTSSGSRVCLSAHARWLQAIQASGNSPEDWLQFTEFMRCNAKFKDDTLCLTFLSRLYAKAIRVGQVKVKLGKKRYSLLW